MNNKFSLKLFCSLALAAGLCACSESSKDTAGGVSEETEGIYAIENKTIAGVSQKGPFVKGTTITLYGMDENLQETGETFTTTLDNNKGEYTLKNVNLKDRYALLTAEGYFIDEFTGEPYYDKISLNSLVDLKDKDHVNINILTHLSFNRILNLVHNGKSVPEAKQQAEKEVLKAFRIEEEEESFDQLNILNDKAGDEKLLAISLIILKAGNEKDIANRMSTIASDIENDGLLNDCANKDFLMTLSFDAVFGVYVDATERLAQMGAKGDSSYLKYIENIALSDTTWMVCSEENEVQKRISDNIHYVICRNGKWKRYYGPIEEGKWEVDTAGKYGTFTDERDKHTYKTLDIKMKDGSTTTWMASALTYEAPKTNYHEEEDMWLSEFSKEEASAYIQQKYANLRLYSAHQLLNLQASADTSKINKILRTEGDIQGICPEGWHIPKKDEWDKLQEAIADNKKIQNLFVFPVYREMEAIYKYIQMRENIIGYYTNVGTVSITIEDSDDVLFKARAVAEKFIDDEFEIKVRNDDNPYWAPLRCVKD